MDRGKWIFPVNIHAVVLSVATHFAFKSASKLWRGMCSSLASRAGQRSTIWETLRSRMLQGDVIALNKTPPPPVVQPPCLLHNSAARFRNGAFRLSMSWNVQLSQTVISTEASLLLPSIRFCEREQEESGSAFRRSSKNRHWATVHRDAALCCVSTPRHQRNPTRHCEKWQRFG